MDASIDRDGAAARRNFLLAGAGLLGVAALQSSPATAAEQGVAGPDGFNGISLLDRMQIMERVARYSWAFDGGDLAAYLDCFWPDGVLMHPRRDGSPGRFEGHEGITSFVTPGFTGRPEQTFGHQHQFSSIVLDREGEDVRLKAYAVVMRHEFHRTYWPTGPSFRMGTWHALFRKRDNDWKIQELDIRMWTDTALGETGKALVDRPAGAPGTRALR
ncbi:MAG: nuclear transport factor 2 family protein [Spongiibacteraceae bacterium]|jgi:hypothetical protein|nr:nuclear transport factor 2 family protein [Spongiibacteraceae bacterium]